ncbi:MAG TPA: energy transducer TonB [Candidatus Wallbacteria bacterium]|nr:energy transducer TonB [Candidatus Wallbacteria bacterium]
MIGNHRADIRFRIFVYIYSLMAHLLLFFCALNYVHGAVTVNQEAIDLKKNARMPFSFKVSLTGRKGNTYDASKKIDGVDMDKIKKNIFDNLNLVKRKYDLAKVYIPEVPKLPEKPAEKKTEPPVPEKPEKKTVAEKKVLEDKKKAEKPKKAEKKEKENRELKARAEIEEKDGKTEVEKKPENKIDAAVTASQPINSARMNSVPGESGPAVYGNMSGDGNTGSDIAGSPDGNADPSIELNRVELFKSIVSEKIKKGVKYPERCRKLGVEGKVRLSFEIAKNGKVLNAGIDRSSGNDEIDASAVAAVKSGEPFLPFPKNSGETIKFVMPLNYELNEE